MSYQFQTNNALIELKRAVLSCMLWEDSFYESGVLTTDRIEKLVQLVNPEEVAKIAISARNDMKLRKIPLFIARCMAALPTHRHLVSNLLYAIIQRPDELTSFLEIYWKKGKCPLSAQVKKGLAKAFTKFNEYSLAKYNRDHKIKLKDVLFLSHAKPLNNEQDLLWKKLINDELEIPETWETQLSAGADKCATFTRLISENKLGDMALLKNLRNMQESGVDRDLVKQAIRNMSGDKVLPFRYISAMEHAPLFSDVLQPKMLQNLAEMPKLKGHTIVLVDVSASMNCPLSYKSTINRIKASGALAMILQSTCESSEIYSFSDYITKMEKRGFDLIDELMKQKHGCTFLGSAIKKTCILPHERMVIITDEQTTDAIEPLNNTKLKYIINVAPYKNGIDYKNWLHIDGFSEATVKYISLFEEELNNGR